MPGREPVRLIFLHIPKTAGSTLRNALRAQYPPRAVYVPAINNDRDGPYLRYLRGESDTAVLASDVNHAQLERLRSFPPDKRDAIRLFMGHYWYGIADDLPKPNVSITMLRDPIERSLSLYSHRVREHGLAVSFERYVEMDREFDIENGQTRRLALSRYVSGRVTPAMLDAAKEHLATGFASVGVTERFDESVVGFALAMGWRAFPYQSVNQSANRRRQEDVAATTLDRLRQRNQFDMELHRFASELLSQQLREVDVQQELRRLARARALVAMRRRAYQLKVVGSRIKRATIARRR